MNLYFSIYFSTVSLWFQKTDHSFDCFPVRWPCSTWNHRFTPASCRTNPSAYSTCLWVSQSTALHFCIANCGWCSCFPPKTSLFLPWCAEICCPWKCRTILSLFWGRIWRFPSSSLLLDLSTTWLPFTPCLNQFYSILYNLMCEYRSYVYNLDFQAHHRSP